MQAMLETLPIEVFHLAGQYQLAIQIIDRIGYPSSFDIASQIRQALCDGEAAITRLNGLLYRWLGERSDEVIAELADAAPDVVDPALRLRVVEPHNLAYLVIREYCADRANVVASGSLTHWHAWRQLRRMSSARAVEQKEQR